MQECIAVKVMNSLHLDKEQKLTEQGPPTLIGGSCRRLYDYKPHHLNCVQAGYVVTQSKGPGTPVFFLCLDQLHNYSVVQDDHYVRYGVTNSFGEQFQQLTTPD